MTIVYTKTVGLNVIKFNSKSCIKVIKPQRKWNGYWEGLLGIISQVLPCEKTSTIDIISVRSAKIRISISLGL